jgi:aquaporin Z
MRPYFAEFIGTYALVFCGTGAIVINDISNGVLGHQGIAITFGAIVMVMIYALGKVSGAHLNPAVSIAFAFINRFNSKDLMPYCIAQLAGALAASLTLALLFPSHLTLGTTVPSGSWQQSFILEIMLTYFLMLVILIVSQNKALNQFSGLAIGGTVLLEAFFAGPITGASMNPARSIGPALVSGNTNLLWIYILAPIIGALFAIGTWHLYAKCLRFYRLDHKNLSKQDSF